MTRLVLAGRTGSPGVGLGRLLLVPSGPNGQASNESGHFAPTAHGTTGADPNAERVRLQAALESARIELEGLAVTIAARAGDEIGAIFEAQALFARDPGIVEPAMRAIAAGARADEAFLRSTDEQAEGLAVIDDEYFRARAADVRDVGRRVADLLRGSPRPDLWHADGRPAVIVADDLDPSAVATLRPELVAGIALAEGTSTGHAAIVARGLGIPLVLGLGAATAVLLEGADGLIDGRDARDGLLIVEPNAEDLDTLASGHGSELQSERPAPVSGGVKIAVTANVGSVLEAEAAIRAGADGVGLVRTELLFLGRTTPPSIAEQRSTYTRIRGAIGDRPVVFRTLDVGGDKPAAWQADRPEANPALGVRGVRLGLLRPDLLDDQLTALLEAAGGAEARIMLPMVATVGEVVEVRRRLDIVLERLRRGGAGQQGPVLLGVMIEVPAAALVADGLAEVADFFSIGTNDLVQYTLAADRVNASLAELATALQPAVLRLIDRVVVAAHARDRHVAVCGEAAADPEAIPLLAGLGVDELSVAPASVAIVRAQTRALDAAACRELATAALLATDVDRVRSLVREASGWAERTRK
jgi:phosphoenolpyruvate-protein phosphotransferase